MNFLKLNRIFKRNVYIWGAIGYTGYDNIFIQKFIPIRTLNQVKDVKSFRLVAQDMANPGEVIFVKDIETKDIFKMI